MPVNVTLTFSDAQVSFIRNAADLVAPGLTNPQLVEWVQQQGVELISNKVKEIIIASLREQHNVTVRSWAEQYQNAFPPGG